MLSRVADSLYWMSRYLERAEHTARLLDVNLHGLLDQRPDVLERRWTRVQRSLCAKGQAGEGVDPQAIACRLSFDPDVAGSVVSCVAAARQNGREVREQISSEMWEQLNRLYLHVDRTRRAGTPDGALHDFFEEVKAGTYLFQGVTDTTMSHEEGWRFIQLGRYLERVIASVNLLDAYLRDFSVAGEPFLSADRYLEWVGLLKSCTAFEAYCRVHTADVRPRTAVAFLLLNPDFPHSVLFGVGQLRQAFGALCEAIPALKQSGILRLVGRLFSTLSFDQIDEIVAGDVPDYLDGIRRRCFQLHTMLYDTCITIRTALTA